MKEKKADRQRRICLRHGFEAKRASSRKRNQQLRERGVVWWQENAIPFKSDAYYALVERAIRAKFDNNETARQALLATGEAELVHDTGKPESPHTSLPAERFIGILTRIRSELLSAQK